MSLSFTFDALQSDLVTHGFFTRSDGVSRGIYSGLNCGIGSNDDPDTVAENRRIVAAELANRRDVPLVSCYQTHSSTCTTVTAAWQVDDRPEADAMVTNKAGIILGILTADCAPVLFVDHANHVIGAAHAGWQGAVKGVVENTVAAMEALGANRDTIISAVGPCIQQASYEVDLTFRDKALAYAPHAEGFFVSGVDDTHLQFDLFGFVHGEITHAQIPPAESAMTPYDTYADESLFYSFRRSTHKNEPDYGRQVSAIMLKA